MKKDWNFFTLSENLTILDAFRKLNELSGRGDTIFAINSDNRVTGSITDGDLRRSLISGKTLETPLTEVMHRNFKYLSAENINVSSIRELRNRKITQIPLLNSDGTISEICDFSKTHSILPLDAVLMAGGKGERLRPLTVDVPKPLLKVGDRCIIDYNLSLLARNSIKNVSVTTNYLSEKIEEYFAQEVCGINVNCVKEPCRLGTIGSVKLIKEFRNENILVMNSDLLTTINLEDFYLSHIESNAALSVATVPYMVSVPYAILKTENNQVVGLEEKPTYNYFANAGIYLINKKVVELIPDNEYFDATDLLERVIEKGMKVNQFPINGTWIDIGSPDDFRQAQELMKQHKMLDF